MTARPCVVIQHHPSRAALLPRLLDDLEDLPVEVVADSGDPPDPWRGYRRCLQTFDPESFSHLVVIQDDAIVCTDFVCELHCAIDAEPDATLILFLASQPRLSAMAANRALELGHEFAPKHPKDYLPAVGICFPAGHVADVLSWTAGPHRRVSRSDDYMLGQWHRARKQRVLVTVPSIVQHPDDVPSVIGNGVGSNGLNRARTALHWAG